MGQNDCCCGKYNAREGSKIIGVTSACFATMSIIGFIWELIKQAREESKLNQILASTGGFGGLLDGIPEYNNLQKQLEQRKITLGVLVGLSLITLLAAVALIFATRKNNRLLALPFMIWTIITQVACGIFIALFIFYCVVADWNDPDQQEALIRFILVPLVCSIINFVLNTWWLVVVFNFYNLLKSGQAFDSIPMQTA